MASFDIRINCQFQKNQLAKNVNQSLLTISCMGWLFGKLTSWKLIISTSIQVGCNIIDSPEKLAWEKHVSSLQQHRWRRKIIKTFAIGDTKEKWSNRPKVNLPKCQLPKSQPKHKMTKKLWLTFLPKRHLGQVNFLLIWPFGS